MPLRMLCSAPTARALADAGEEELFAMKTGFRAKYIYDAARRVADGELDLDAIVRMENYADAEGELMKIKGVGPKVAACALLFGFGKTEAYPVDTWMKKVTARHFKSAPDPKKFGKAAGIAQQYLFYMDNILFINHSVNYTIGYLISRSDILLCGFIHVFKLQISSFTCFTTRNSTLIPTLFNNF